MVEHNDIEDDAPQDLTTDSTGKSEPKPPADGGAAPLPAAKRAGDGTGAPEGQPDGGEQPMEGEGGKGAGEGESDDSGGQGGDKKSEKGNEGKDEGDEEEGGDKKSEKGNEGKDEGDDEGDDGDSDDEDDSDEDEKKDEQDEEDLVGKAVGIIEKASRHHGMAGTVVSKKSADAWNVLFFGENEPLWEYSRDEFVVEGDTVYFLKNKMTRTGKIQSILLKSRLCEIMSAWHGRRIQYQIPIKDIIKKVADKKDKDEDKHKQDKKEDLVGKAVGIIEKASRYHGMAGTVVSKKSADAWNVLFFGENEHTPQWEWEYSRDEFVIEGDTVEFLFSEEYKMTGKIQSILLDFDFCEIMSAGTGTPYHTIPIKDIIKKVADKKDEDEDKDDKQDKKEEDLVGKTVGIIENQSNRHRGMAGTVVSKKSADAWNVLFPPQWEWEYSRDEFVVEGDTVYFLKNKMTRVGKIQSIFLNVDFCEIMSAGTEFKIPIKDIIKKVADKKDKDEDKDGSEETRFATLEIIRQVFAEYGLKLNLDTADNITLYAHAMFTPTITEAIGEIYFQHIHPDEKLKEVVELDLVVAKKIMSIIVDKPEYFEKDGEVRKFTDVLTDIGATSLVFSTTILADENGDDNGEDNWNLTLTPISPLVSSRKDKADLILVIPKHGNAGNVRLNYLARGMKELYVFHNLDAKSDYAVEFDDYLWLIKEFNNAKAKRLIVSREYNNFAVSKIKEYLNKLSDAV